MSRPKLKTILVCEAATIDQQNRAVIYGIFDQIQSREVPVTHPQFTVFCVWEGEGGSQHRQTLKIFAPSKKLVAQVVDAPFTIGRPNARVLTSFNLMRFEEWGRYKIEVEADGEKADEIYLELKKVAQG